MVACQLAVIGVIHAERQQARARIEDVEKEKIDNRAKAS